MMPGCPSTSPKTSGSLRRPSIVVPGRGCSSALERLSVLPFASVNGDRRDLVAEAAGGDGPLGALLRLERVGVGRLARDAVLAREHLRRLPHDHAADRAGEAVAIHGVDEREVPHPMAPARVFGVDQVRHAAHRLDAAGERRPPTSPSMIDCAPLAIVCMPEAQALLIVCAGTASGMPARMPTCRAGFGPDPAWRAWPISTSSTVAGVEPRRASAPPWPRPRQLGRMHVPQRTAVAADRRARGADDHDVRQRP